MKQMRSRNTRLSKVVTMQMSGRSEQEGAALIAVLLFLILISLAGVMAVKQSSTDLKLATSDQINTLLLQSSDAGQQQLEKIVNGSRTDGTQSAQAYDEVLSIPGVFGYYILNDSSAYNEYSYCFNNDIHKYLIKNGTVWEPTLDADHKATAKANAVAGSGYCDLGSASGYTSSRLAVMTHMSVVPNRVNEYVDEPFQNIVQGEDASADESISHLFDIRATSTLPSYASGSIKDCFNKTNVPDYSTDTDTDITVEKCLNENDSPAKTVVEKAVLEQVSIPKRCTKFGKPTDAQTDFDKLCS